MVDLIANKITDYFIKNNYIEPNKKNYFAYGAFDVISSALHITLLFLVSIPFKTLPYIIIFTLFFCNLKKYCGGAHANSHLQCQVLFTSLAFFASLLGIAPIPDSVIKIIAISFAIISFAMIFIWAPIPHPNKRVDEEELKLFRKKSLFISSIETLIIILTCVSGNYLSLILCASTGALASSLTLVPMILKKGELKS